MGLKVTDPIIARISSDTIRYLLTGEGPYLTSTGK